MTFRIEGIIGEGGATARALSEFLQDTPGPAEIVVNSPGGNAFEGAAMAAEVERHGNVTSRGIGIVASAATLPLIAAREIALHRDVAFMIHDPAAITFGPAASHRKAAMTLDKLSDVYAAAYARATGTPVPRIKKWMADETWLTAEEAVALHFADRIEGGEPVALAAFDVTQFRNPPAALVRMARANGWAAVPPESSSETEIENA